MSRPWVDLLPPTNGDELGTAAADLVAASIGVTLTQTTADLTEHSGVLRARAHLLRAVSDETHQQSYDVEWRVLTNRCSAASPVSLLAELADLGFAWRDLARLMGVSVPAIQKWRKGDGVSGPNRRKIASLLTACEMINRHYEIREIASWFEMPLLENVPVTPIDLWASGNQLLVFEHASGHVDPAETLDLFEPDWREHYRTGFETFVGEDGNLSLKMKDR